MKCPKCGGDDVNTQILTETTSKGRTKGFGCVESCIGVVLFNLPGILCGLCGLGKGKHKTSTKEKVVHVCQNCGKRW